jgi:hypothetical protein
MTGRKRLQAVLAGADCSRRAFLLSVMAGALAAAGCGDQGAGASRESAAALPPAWLEGAVGNTAAAARLGQLYLEAHPAEQELNTLIAGIDAALAPALETGATDTAAVLAALRRAVKDDYIHSRVASLQGWLLSRTEARVYAALSVVAEE